MVKKIIIIFLCSVAIIVTALFSGTQTLAQKKVYTEDLGSNQIKVELRGGGKPVYVKKKYERSKNGCVKNVKFLNEYHDYDWKDISGTTPPMVEPKPLYGIPSLVGKWIKPDKRTITANIHGETLVGVGFAKGDPDDCENWRIALAGSPGWDCDYISGSWSCSCIGDYYGPENGYSAYAPGWCCDRNGCLPFP